MVLNHEDYVSVRAHSKRKSRRAGVHHVVGKVENKWNGRFPNSEFTQISKWQYHACLALSRSSRGSVLSSRSVREGEMQKDSWGKENMDRVGFLQRRKERCSVFTFLNYQSYATLEPATGTQVVQAPPEKRSENLPKTAWRSVLRHYGYARLQNKTPRSIFLVLFANFKNFSRRQLKFR